MDEVITKRIHISGLTPAITAKDLTDRFTSFGTVTSIDGFGKLDGVGQPRKYAYATLETTKGKLARCMNLLSGVTWKGAKLRLGEAKPDFRERIAKEHAELKRAAEEAEDSSPKKRRRLPRGVQGVHARDMSLVTPENVSTRGGWRVTPTGRLVRPLRMRPSHPLPEPLDAAKPKEKERGQGKKEKIRKRVRDAPTRARRKTIDPTKWGSQHLKGIFLENAAAYIPPRPLPSRHTEQDIAIDGNSENAENESSDESSEEEEEETSDSSPESTNSPPPGNAPAQRNTPASVAASRSSLQTSSIARELVEEKNQSLGLLQSLFGDQEDWGGAESVGSDVEVDEDTPVARLSEQPDVPAAEDAGAVMDVDEVNEPEPGSPEPQPQDGLAMAPAGRKANLKDLFAPREEEAHGFSPAAGFSLLGHLDLDLDLDEDFDFQAAVPSTLSRPSAPVQPVQPTVHVAHTVSLDATRPFFFPSDHAGAKGRVMDPTHWRTWFYRTDSPEAIRARWEETKGELTAGWKRRHREAIKSRRRRGGGAGEVD
ncbi:hypothetical protein C8Q80DRAFT_1259810 [Daedaleopsis nitida]|nr:hypothetical protein C8Q80DRAFT_1259810 [Daedaleopsis nitida]